MNRIAWSASLIFIGTLFFCMQVTAQEGCTVTHPQNSLGNQSSAAIARSAISMEIEAGLNCSLAALNMMDAGGADGVEGQLISSGNNMKLVGPGGKSITYQLYADAAFSEPLFIGKSIQFTQLRGQGRSPAAGSRSLPIYIKTQPGSNVDVGFYHDSVMISWKFPRCVSMQEGVCTEQQMVTENGMLDISLYAGNSCAIISAPNVSFGTYSFVAQFPSVTQSVVVNCTAGTPYSAEFNNGFFYSNGWKRMWDLDSNFLQYNIYYYGTTTVWNSNNPYNGTGTGSNQTLQYTATINPAQSEQPAGNYYDIVNFTVQY